MEDHKANIKRKQTSFVLQAQNEIKHKLKKDYELLISINTVTM